MGYSEQQALTSLRTHRRSVKLLSVFPLPKHTFWRMENLPVWEHWVLNVQSLTPRFKPVDVLSRLSPECLGTVPG